MITMGIISAHSVGVLPRNVGFAGARKSSQKYPIMAAMLETKNRTPKDLFLNRNFTLELNAKRTTHLKVSRQHYCFTSSECAFLKIW
jgi:hypothetical protein